MSGKDWIPRREQDLIDLLVKWASWLTDETKMVAFGWDPETCALVVLAIEGFIGARTDYQNGKTKIKRIAKDEKWAAVKAAARDFANTSIRFNDKMSVEDKFFLGIPPRDTVRTRHPTPTLKPQTEAEPSGKGKHTVTAVNPELHNKKRPPNATGVSFARRVRLPTEPKSVAEEMPSIYQVSPIRDFQWLETDYGKVADYATAYEKEGGGRGPWSDVVSVIIA